MKFFLLLITCSFLFSCRTTHYCYIVRHAEKMDTTSFSLLSPAGHQRAVVLRESLVNKKIDLIFATNLERTQQTAMPLAEVLHKPVLIYRHNAIDSIVNIVRNLKNKNVLLVGHSGTIPRIVADLTGKKISPILEGEYDNMYIIKVKNQKTELVATKY